MKIFRASPGPDSNSSRRLWRRCRTGARAPGAGRIRCNNVLDDVTWTKGKHTITMGLNFRFNRNNTSTFTNAFPLYAYGATELIGLGEDIDTSVQSYLAGKLGNPNLQLANPTAVTNASATLLGILNDVFVTYQYTKSGQVLPQGTPQQRSFIERTYAGYIGDTYRVSRELTLNFGLRYENFRPPYEANGLQVDTTVPLNQYFAQRNGLQSQGIPANQMSDFTLSYALNGPANGKPSWWSPDNANFAPRFGLAYAPADHAGLIGKLFGKNGAFRVGGAIAYDQFGNDLIVNYDQYGSLGLSNPTNFPDSYSFTTSPRFTGAYPDSAAFSDRRVPVHSARDRRHHRHFPWHFARSENAVFDHSERGLLARVAGQNHDGSRLHGQALAPAADGRRRVYAARELQGSRLRASPGSKTRRPFTTWPTLWRQARAFRTTMPLPWWRRK